MMHSNKPRLAVKNEPGDECILTDKQVRQLERSNIVRALDAAEGKVSGPDGAAVILGIKPSTLASRMKAMDIRRGVV